MSTESIAFLFPGQGSQRVGMLAQFSTHYPIIPATFAEASKVLNFDLWKLAQQGPADILEQTENTQPALLAASVALWRVWQQEKRALPVLLAGHSLGEYSALVCAEAIDFAEAVKLVRKRGQVMQQAVPLGQGGMAAILGLTDEQVRQACQRVNEEMGGEEQVAPANYNSIGQVVVAGYLPAIERIMQVAKEMGALLVKRLPMSVPSHSPLMREAAKQFADYLQTVPIYPPKIPLINNVDVAIESEPERIRSALIRQLSCPVRWVGIIQMLVKDGIYTAVECGPGKVLTGLNKRIDERLTTTPIESLLEASQYV